MYKLKSSAKDCDDLSTGFDRTPDKRRDELTNDRNITGNNHLTNMLKVLFGFAENQEKATYGFSSKLTLTRNKDEAVIDKAMGIADASFKLDHIHWYVAQYTPSIQQQSFLSNRIFKKTPTGLRYVQRSVFM